MEEKIEYINHNSYSIQVKGPDGRSYQFKKMQKRLLPTFFDRYCPRYLKPVSTISDNKVIDVKKPMPDDQGKKPKISKRRENRLKVERNKSNRNIIKKPGTKSGRTKLQVTPQQPRRGRISKPRTNRRRVVGIAKYRSPREATKHFKGILDSIRISMSNDIGIGILSFNRLSCVRRLLESIRKYSSLKKLCVFVSDESTDQKTKSYLRDQKDITLVDNDKRIGVAGNTNRLFRCLDRFKYKIILNDDVEVLHKHWEQLYVSAMKSTGYHHFCMRQDGVYGAGKEGEIRKIKDLSIQTINKKPHGAVIAFDDIAFEKVGYFDENRFGLYGMEHVDWSNRVSLSNIQPSGYHDVLGSERFFKIHNEASCMDASKRRREFSKAKKTFDNVRNNKKRIFVGPSAKSEVRGVSYIVPFRGKSRELAIKSVIANIKAQKFPRIEIIVVEQDDKTQITSRKIGKAKHVLAPGRKPRQPFTKSLACNRGVAEAKYEIVIIHDADMLVGDTYTSKVDDILQNYEACHICKHVTYMSEPATNSINRRQEMSDDLSATSTINYFEGGSLACRRRSYFKIGGFNERFIGYGVEDCEFFERLKKLTRFHDVRTFDLIHLWHDRAAGWNQRHDDNKAYYKELEKIGTAKRIAMLMGRLEENGYGSILKKYDL